MDNSRAQLSAKISVSSSNFGFMTVIRIAYHSLGTRQVDSLLIVGQRSGSTCRRAELNEDSKDVKEYELKPKGETSLHDALKNTIRIKHPKSVGELAYLIQASRPVNEDDFADEIMALVREGIIELTEPSYQTKSIADYLTSATLSGWLWASMALTVVAVLTVVFIPDNFPVNIVRWILSSAFVIYLPGYMFIQAIFPNKEDFNNLERFLFSVGVSLAVVSLVGLILNYLPLGLRLIPITIALTVFVVFFALVAATRKFRSLRASSD